MLLTIALFLQRLGKGWQALEISALANRTFDTLRPEIVDPGAFSWAGCRSPRSTWTKLTLQIAPG
jgi:hypothetical protein